MKILVSNIGSTSFKFRLFDFDGGRERELAAGGVDRIGSSGGVMSYAPSGGAKTTRPCACADHAAAITACLEAMAASGVLAGPGDIGAVAFKAVMAGDAPAVTLVDEQVLSQMEYFYPVAPAHNPPYVAAMRSFAKVLPQAPLVAAFEPGFHRTIPQRRRIYAVPPEWDAKLGIRRYGFHGASHRYVSQRARELQPAARRIISCHLGGSSSLCAVRDGASVATSMGFSPQSGLPQSNRVGDFDAYALALVARQTGMNLEQMLKALGESGGLAAMSGTSGDMRDILSAMQAGSAKARLAFEAFVTAIRDNLGAFLVELGGADAIVFTGGIGENAPPLRWAVCTGLGFAGVVLDESKNAAAKGEMRIEAASSACAIWVMPTNEELVVARQAMELLSK